MSKSNEVWISMVRDKFPGLRESKYQELKQDASLQWCAESKTELAEFYDSYVMMKRLMNIQVVQDK